MIDSSARTEIWPVRLNRFVVAVGRRFYHDQCLLHASALTYTSLLSLVPLLALMFAILKGLGVQRRLEPLLLSRLALDPEVTERILTFIDRTNVATLGALGAVALIATVVSVLSSIEFTFNHIWRVRQGRTWWRKLTDYMSTVLLTPFLLLAGVAVTSSVQQQDLLRAVLQTEYVGQAVLQTLRLAPLMINAVAFGVLYAVMPNRRPCVPGVVVGALVGGCAWQMVQWSYVSLQIGVARYNAIYGALAQLPVTLVWIYVSWTVVLAGAQVAAVWEYGAEPAESHGRKPSRWAIALHVLLRAAEAFREGKAIKPRTVARELRVDTTTLAEVAEQLQAGGFLAAVDGSSASYVLARDPATIDLAIVEALADGAVVPDGCDPRVSRMLQDLSVERQSRLSRYKLIDILELGKPPEST